MANPLEHLLSNEQQISDMLKVYEESSVVEQYNEGDYVIKCMLSNIPISAIIRELNKKHNVRKFTTADVKYFLQRNPDMAQRLILRSNEMLDTHVKTYMNHELALAKLYEENKELLNLVKNDKEFSPRFDSETMIKITKNMHDIVLSDAKIRGRFKENTEVNINVQAKELVNQIVSNPTDLQKEILGALNRNTVIEVSGSEITDNPVQQNGSPTNNQ